MNNADMPQDSSYSSIINRILNTYGKPIAQKNTSPIIDLGPMMQMLMFDMMMNNGKGTETSTVDTNVLMPLGPAGAMGALGRDNFTPANTNNILRKIPGAGFGASQSNSPGDAQSIIGLLKLLMGTTLPGSM
jgi:hypothetical protein